MTTILVLLSTFLTSFTLYAEEDLLQSQKIECSKSTAMEWNSELNRCVGKAQARKDRHDAQDCNALTDVEARKACHMNLATTKTGVTDDPEQAAGKITSGQSRSTIVNTANTIVSAINMFAKDSSNSQCMSKQIFGITALGGFLTDIMMKIQTKKKLDSLKDKFILDNKDNPYSSQVKALEFLKEEQEVIKKVASQEKKRQMLLMIGYGAAAVVAAYETFYDSTCYKPEPKKNTPQPDQAAKQAAPTEAGSTTEPAKETVVAKADEKPAAPAPDAAPEPVTPSAPAPEQPKVADTPVDRGPTEATLKSQKNGNYQHNYLEKDGKVVGVVHNGEVYPNYKVNKDGIYVAVGKPQGAFNYSTGTWGNVKVSETAFTTNYSLSDTGKISTLKGGSTTKIQNTSFGTGKK